MARYFGNNRGKALSVATLGGMAGVMFLPYISLNYFTNIRNETALVLRSFYFYYSLYPIYFF